MQALRNLLRFPDNKNLHHYQTLHPRKALGFGRLVKNYPLCSEIESPNITGVTMPVMNITGNMSGAFSLGNYLYKTISDGTHFSMYDMKFTASTSNSAYSGSSVQPKAVQALIIIKA